MRDHRGGYEGGSHARDGRSHESYGANVFKATHE